MTLDHVRPSLPRLGSVRCPVFSDDSESAAVRNKVPVPRLSLLARLCYLYSVLRARFLFVKAAAGWASVHPVMLLIGRQQSLHSFSCLSSNSNTTVLLEAGHRGCRAWGVCCRFVVVGINKACLPGCCPLLRAPNVARCVGVGECTHVFRILSASIGAATANPPIGRSCQRLSVPQRGIM